MYYAGVPSMPPACSRPARRRVFLQWSQFSRKGGRMFLKPLSLLACGVLAVAGFHLPNNGCPVARTLAAAYTSASLDDKKDDTDKPALSGAWVKKEGELKIVFAGKNMMSIHPQARTRGA